MKKKLYLFLIIVSFSKLSGHDFNVYKEVKIKTFNFGSQSFQLGFNRNPDPIQNRGPQSIFFDKNGKLVINDTHKSRLMIFDLQYNVISEIDLKHYSKSLFSSTFDSYVYEKKYYGNVASKEFITLDNDGSLVFSLDLYDSPIHKELDAGNFYILGNNIFYNLKKSGEWVLFYDLGSDKNKNIKNMYKGDELITFLDKESKNINSDFYDIYINDNFLMKGNELLTRDFHQYTSFWQEKQKHMQKPNNLFILPDGTQFKDIGLPTIFIGEDKDFNKYWAISNFFIFVFNKDGWLIDAIEINNSIMKVRPTVHPTGDIYFIDYDSKEVIIFKIPRQW